MAQKRFNADVVSARGRLAESGFPGVELIERGDSDGEVVVHFHHDEMEDGVIVVRMLAQNLDAYPNEHSFLVFTDSDDAPPSLTEALSHVQNFLFGHSVLEAIRDISGALGRHWDQTNQDDDTDMDDSDGESDAYYDNDFDEYDSDDKIFGSKAGHASTNQSQHSGLDQSVLKRLKQDLRNAREAGVKVGIIQGVNDSAGTHKVSLSLRADRLGLSDESLEAWDIEPSAYIVLEISMGNRYPSADKLANESISLFKMEFRFGKCTKYKPNGRSAQNASDAIPQQSSDADDPGPDGGVFEKLFISKSLEQFMNEHFMSLFKLRLRGLKSWDVANMELSELSARVQDDMLISQSKSDEPRTMPPRKCKEPAQTSATQALEEPTNLLLLDPLVVPVDEISTPLVAMHFAMHYFVRCTEYCLRCHRKIDKEFEAMRPFVCSNPLCLFQYITMGFGPSVEHEIATQPYVVDLLVTLCHASVQERFPGFNSLPMQIGSNVMQQNFGIRQFPTGLRLKVPRSSQRNQGEASLDTSIAVVCNLNVGIMKVMTTEDLKRISDHTWATLRHSPQGRRGQILAHLVCITHVDHSTNEITIVTHQEDPDFASLGLTGEIEMSLHVHEEEFDDLDDTGKATAMVSILNTIPPVARMREYLAQNPDGDLSSCPGLSPAALTLLKWIVASNRSCILQVSHVEDHRADDLDLAKNTKTREQEIIPSMGEDVVQFRFAQGTPDKEIRFHRALKDLTADGKAQYPTLLAWHGSALRNWHSILRQGLDFETMMNGRAYGNGVYFSHLYDTSKDYANAPVTWPNSALQAAQVIALCEIINSPDQFVSSSPHYVVDKLDWIQCRYLFVAKRYSPETSLAVMLGGKNVPHIGTSSLAQKQNQVAEFSQDPQRRVQGPKGVDLKIPLKALASSGSSQQANQQNTSIKSPTKTKRTYDALTAFGDTDEEDSSDIAALLSDDGDAQPPLKRGTPSKPWASNTDTAKSQKEPATSPAQPLMTDFRPGHLDLKTVPRLALPQWADSNSTKRLASVIKQLQKAQATTPLHELGWYIDFENIENMFQWIVELHTFDSELPLAKDMKKANITSIVLEVRFGQDYPFSPPFVRVIRPRFLPFMSGGGGHVTIGGAVCMELLTSNGWTPATSMEAVFVSIKMAMSSSEPRPARLENASQMYYSRSYLGDYGAGEALAAFERAARTHGWTVPKDVYSNATQAYTSG